MAQYSDGLVSTTADSNTVTGSGTLWQTNNIAAGNEILISDDNIFFTVASVTDETHLTLTANYPVTRANVSYVITTDFTSNRSLPLVNQGDLHFADLHSRAMRLIDKFQQWGESFVPHEYSNGLTFYYGAGFFILKSGTKVSITAGSVILSDEETNYVEVNSAGTVSRNAVGFTAGSIPLYTVTTMGGAILTTTDCRSPYTLDKEPVITLHYPAQMTNGVSNVDYVVRDINRKYRIAKYAISADGLTAATDVTLALRTAISGGGSGQNMTLPGTQRNSGVQSLTAALSFAASDKFVIRGDGKGISIVTVQLFQA